MKLNNVLQPGQQANSNGYQIQNSTIYTLVSKVNEALLNTNAKYNSEVVTRLEQLKNMYACVDSTNGVSNNDADKLIRQSFEVALADLGYNEKIVLLNSVRNKKYVTSTVDVIPETGTISTVSDVAKSVIDFLGNKTPFKDDEISYFKIAYNEMVDKSNNPTIFEKIVNGDFKSLWKAYRELRDKLAAQVARIF